MCCACGCYQLKHLHRITAVAPFVPADETWLAMTADQRRQVIAEVVEFVIQGVYAQLVGLQLPLQCVVCTSPERDGGMSLDL